MSQKNSPNRFRPIRNLSSVDPTQMSGGDRQGSKTDMQLERVKLEVGGVSFNLSNPKDGDIITYDAATISWVNRKHIPGPFGIGTNEVSTQLLTLAPLSTQFGLVLTASNSDAIEVRNGGGTVLFAVTPNGSVIAPNYSETVVTVTAPYTVLSTDGTILADTTAGGNFTITLLDAVSCIGRVYTIKNIGNNTLTVNTLLGQLIDTYTSVTYQFINTSADFRSNGTNWDLV